MKKFSTLIFLLFVSYLATGNVFSGTFVPEKEFIDGYRNKIIVQDGAMNNNVSTVDTWVVFQKNSIPSSVIVSYQENTEGKTKAKDYKLTINGDGAGYLYTANIIAPGDWLIKVFSLTSQGEKGKELASFSYAVRPGRTILIRFYLQ